jgi:hypothetical protein
MGTPRPIAAAALALLLARPATAQQVMPNTDSGAAEIRVVLRAFYANLQNQNWDALSAYVLSPKLLERRGHFESRWRFIYTDLFEAPAAAETARR